VRAEPWRIGAWVLVVGALAAIGYGSRAGGARPEPDALYRYETAIGGAIVYLLLLALVALIVRGLPLRDVFALYGPRSWRRALGLALGAYVTIFLGAGLLLRALGATDEQGLTPSDWDPTRAGAYAANFVAVAFVGPVVEELVYRGAGMSLLARFGVPLAVVVTAIAFGLGHGLRLALPALVFFGLVVALLRLRTRSIYPPMVVHCAFNATSLIVSVAA
jgi:membrane protease YdiL (CAAX protease family)